MSKLRWGLLSTARINRALIDPLKNSERNELAAVASRDLSRAQTYAHERNIPKAYGSYEDLLADSEIDVIYNPLPNHLHLEWTLKAAAAGKHVLCEKPIALTVGDVDQMQAAANTHRVVIMEAFMYRHHPQTLKAKELIDAGAIGNLHLIRGAFTFTMTKPDDFRWNPEWGGGGLWDVGCYPLSFSRFVVGAEPAEVFAQQVLSPSGVDVSLAAQLRFANGVLAQFDCGVRSQHRTFMEFVGSAGTLYVPRPWRPDVTETITLTRGDAVETITINGANRYALEIENLADAILLGQTPRVTLAESRGNVAAIVALLESAKTGKVLQLTTDDRR